MFLLSVNIYFTIKLIQILREDLGENNQLMFKYSARLKWFPIIQIICFLPNTICRILHFNSKGFFAFEIIRAVTESSSGFIFSIVYAYNPIIKKKIADLFCCNKRKNKKLELNEKSEDMMNNTSSEISNTTLKSLLNNTKEEILLKKKNKKKKNIGSNASDLSNPSNMSNMSNVTNTDDNKLICLD